MTFFLSQLSLARDNHHNHPLPTHCYCSHLLSTYMLEGHPFSHWDLAGPLLLPEPNVTCHTVTNNYLVSRVKGRGILKPAAEDMEI